MLYYETIYPESMAGELYDRFLAAGWYRIGQSMITTDLITQAYLLVPVYWLRIRLDDYQPSRSARRIARKCSHLSVHILPFAITPETERLYACYRESISHAIAPTAHEYLLDTERKNAFDSRRIELRDGNTLCAVGFFDLGARASTGILHIYHPDYAHLSPGKMLYLATLDYSRQQGLAYYYPGYISPSTRKFDYKLFADPASTEVYLRPLARWVPYLQVRRKLPRWGDRVTAITARRRLNEVSW